MDLSNDKVAFLIESLDTVADRVQGQGLIKEAEEIDVVSNTLEKMAKTLPAGKDRPVAIFPKEHPKVTDGKDHYPIPDKAHGRAALQRLSQFKDQKPDWWSGSTEELKNAIIKAVKGKFPGMDVEEDKFKEASFESPVAPSVKGDIEKYLRFRHGDELLDTIFSGDTFIRQNLDIDNSGDGDNGAVLKHLRDTYHLRDNDALFILNSLITKMGPD
jgi:hypothetical protein